VSNDNLELGCLTDRASDFVAYYGSEFLSAHVQLERLCLCRKMVENSDSLL